MKIAVFSTYYGTDIGGAEVSTRLFVDGMVKQGTDISIITANNNAVNDRISIYKIPLFRYYPTSFLIFDFRIIDFILFLQIKRILREIKPDLLHIQDLELSYPAVKAAKALGIKTLITVRDHRFLCTLPLFDKQGEPISNYTKADYIKKLKELSLQRYKLDISLLIYHFLKNKHLRFRYALNNADKIVTVSEYMRYLVLSIGIPEQKIQAIYNLAPDIQLSSANIVTEKSSKSSKSLKKEKFIIFAPGRLEEYKGFQVLIRAFAKLCKNELNLAKSKSSLLSSLSLIIAGDGTYASELKKLAASLNLNDHVIFLGKLPINKIYQEYSKAEIVVLPSICPESLSRVIWESFSSQKPLIATSVGGTSEIVKHNKTGILVRPNDPDDLARAIVNLATNKRLQKNLIKNAKKYITNHNNCQLRQYLCIYQLLTNLV